LKYSDQLALWLSEMGYTHCFYVGGGNIMHLTESLSQTMTCIPVIHEVAAGISAEYFNEASTNSKAVALVTAGPGLTNIVTAIAGAFLESRELLVLGGQVKTSDLASGQLRQNGIQEIGGVELVKSICKKSIGMNELWSKQKFIDIVSVSKTPRKGPVFIEIPLDVQGREFIDESKKVEWRKPDLPLLQNSDLEKVANMIKTSQRPVLMLGGGVNRETMISVERLLGVHHIPVVTTWNGADRLASDHRNYCGRPNTWGQRRSNIIMQQADLLIAVGTRLGMQQTGFNWHEFIPVGDVIQVDLDHLELEKEHPIVKLPIVAEANDFLVKLLAVDLGGHEEWLDYCREVLEEMPLIESNANTVFDAYVSPYDFVQKLSKLARASDIIIPCSSGSAFTIMMQVFQQKKGQTIITNKGLASMGYGLSGAIGASFAHPEKRVILIEGDGGFSQNLQEIGTAAINNLNMKVFIFNDGGYASIRMTQKNYFSGSYVGCDIATGLGLPEWEQLLKAWGVDAVTINKECFESESYVGELEKIGFSFFIVCIAPEQTYFPKISSRIAENGQMVSNPLHLMAPELPDELQTKFLKYLNKDKE